jgi:WD40 repeat protein
MNLFQQRDLLAAARKSASAMLIITTFITGLTTQSLTAMPASQSAANSGSTSNGPANQSAPAISSLPTASAVAISDKPHDAASPTETGITLTGSDKDGKEAKEKVNTNKEATIHSAPNEKHHVFQGRFIGEFEAHEIGIEQIMYISNTACFATRALDNTIQTWSWDALFNPTPEDPLTKHFFWGFMDTCAILSNTLIVAPDRGKIFLLYPRTGVTKTLSIKLPVHDEPINIVTLPEHYLVITNLDGTIQIYHHYALKRRIVTDRFINVIALDQKHIATLSSETADIWNIQTGERRNRIALENACIGNVGMTSLANNRIALCEENTISIWNWKTNRMEAKTSIDTSYIPYMTALANGHLAFVGATGACTKLYVWNPQTTTTQHVDTCKGRIRISCIASQPDGYLLVGCTDGSVRIYG